MSLTVDIYSEKIKILRKENMQKVKNLLEDNDQKLLYKIRVASERYDIPIPSFIDAIKQGNPIALAFFAKDPSKQKIHEKIAAGYIQKIEGVQEFYNLPNICFP